MGLLLAGEILRCFISEYQADHDFNRMIQMEAFQSFHQKLPDAIHGVVQRILRNRTLTGPESDTYRDSHIWIVKQTRGVRGAMFKGENNSQIACNIDNVDEIGIAANLSGVMDAALDISKWKRPLLATN